MIKIFQIIYIYIYNKLYTISRQDTLHAPLYEIYDALRLSKDGSILEPHMENLSTKCGTVPNFVFDPDIRRITNWIDLI